MQSTVVQSIELENILSRVRRQACCERWDKHRGVFFVRFPLCGLYEFSSRDGSGRNRLSEGWKIPMEWIRVLRGDPDYKPLPRLKKAKKARTVAVDPRQTDWTK